MRFFAVKFLVRNEISLQLSTKSIELMVNFEEFYSPQQVCEFLQNEIPMISGDILEKVIAHDIDGEVFLEIDDKYSREIAPLVGDRFRMKRAIRTAVNLTTHKLVCLMYLSHNFPSRTPVSSYQIRHGMVACLTKESLQSVPITPSVTMSIPRSVIPEDTDRYVH